MPQYDFTGPLPEVRIVINDTAETRRIMEATGSTHLFDQYIDEPDVYAVSLNKNHSTHWLVFTLRRGHPKAEENGLLLEAIPKAVMTLAELKAYVQQRTPPHSC